MENIKYKKNDIVEIIISDIADGGEGIGKISGFAVFVKDALPGDRVRASFTKVKKNYAYARLVEVLEASPYRVTPRCPVSRACGGCQLQSYAYEKQLEFKASKVRNDLIRIGGFSEELIDGIREDIIGMEMPYRYRNKAQYPIGTDKNEELTAGFYAGRTHDIIPMDDCVLGDEINKTILEIILGFMKKKHIPAYDEATGEGLVRHVLIRKSFSNDELMLCIVINGETFPDSKELVDELKNINGMTSFSLSPNTSRSNVIMGNICRTIWGRDHIKDILCFSDGTSLQFRISPLSFYQVNSRQMVKLYEKAREYAGLTGRETVWDLYCGIGTISLMMATQAAKVFGVEIVPQAIEDAKKNAALNNLDNAEFLLGKAEEVLPEYYSEHEYDQSEGADKSLHPDVIVVDPPRKGCDEKCLETMVRMLPERIVYVSCDPATLSRDLKYLCENGYEIKRYCPVDMFPQGVHVETVCLLSKLHEAKHHVSVKLDMDELDLTSAEAKATYNEIRDWVQEHYGMHVTNLNIAQVKQKHGIIERENYNKPKSENSRQPGCPEKVKAINKYKIIH